MRRRVFAFATLLLVLLAVLTPQAFAVSPSDWNSETPEVLEAGHLYSQAAVVTDADTGAVLFEKDARVRMYPASTTKIMTLLLAVESGISLDQEITIPDVAQRVPGGSSLVPVFAGEVMTLRDLLYGFMLTSGNDGANAVAQIVGGSIDNFVVMMNARAAEIGCTGTHFSNAHGYHDDTHYTTAMDLALIAQAAMRNETFREIVSTVSYTMAATVNRGEYTITNSNVMIDSASNYYYEGCVGIKTGFTSKAGQCLVGAAVKDGVSLVSVALRSSTDSGEKTRKWRDTGKLFEYGFAQYEPYLLTDLFEASGRDINTVYIENASREDPQKGTLALRLTQISDGDFKRRVRSGMAALAEAVADFNTRVEISFNENLRAPLAEGEIVGTLTYTASDGKVVTAMLAADRDVEARAEHATIYDVLPFLSPLEPFFESSAVWYTLLALAILVILLSVLRARRRARRDRHREEIYVAKRREYNRMVIERRREALRRRKEAERRRLEAVERQRESERRRREAARARAAAGHSRDSVPARKRPPAARPVARKKKPRNFDGE